MTNQQRVNGIEELSQQIRRSIFDMAYNAGASSAHIGGALSIADINATLFGAVMKLDPKDPEWPDRDRYILSKGHACLAYYAALGQVGYLSSEELISFEKTGSPLLGHPVMNRSKGIEFSNGSLGMGLSLGVGLAIAGKRRRKDYKVFVVIGDGECNEGSIWESAMASSHFQLDNLVGIIDHNSYQQTGTTSEVMNIGDLADKWSSFGWFVSEVDGHDCKELYDALSTCTNQNKPRALICKTVKGKGVSFAENSNSWHHAVVTESQYKLAIQEIDRNRPT